MQRYVGAKYGVDVLRGARGIHRLVDLQSVVETNAVKSAAVSVARVGDKAGDTRLLFVVETKICWKALIWDEKKGGS